MSKKHLTAFALVIPMLLLGFGPPSTVEFDFHPQSNQHFDLLQNSDIPLDSAGEAMLEQMGFAITGHEYLTFAQAYDTIYYHDLPVYITADSILYSIHRSYDAVLKYVEVDTMIPPRSNDRRF